MSSNKKVFDAFNLKIARSLSTNSLPIAIGFGLPVYNYMLLQDGSVMAEVSVLPLGVVGRCAAKTKNEVRTIFKGSRSNCLMIVFFYIRPQNKQLLWHCTTP